MFDSRNIGPGGLAVDSFGGLLDITSAPVGFGYYERNEVAAETGVEWNTRRRTGKIGWWNRHRFTQAAISATIVLTLGLLPATQNAILSVITHVG
ncbi:hypothetical protein [Nocardia sp. NPDC052566]|uniref:hypothetical protein n=1 Tax=Nocardia sp. NPDC052566 TaxID=3364330 RepID=UPI0037C51440